MCEYVDYEIKVEHVTILKQETMDVIFDLTLLVQMLDQETSIP